MSSHAGISEATATDAAQASRIVTVLHDFSGGGSERVAIRLANAWAARGRQVTILCGTEAGPARQLVAPEVAVLGLRPALPRGPLSRIRLGIAMAPHIRLIEPDLIFGPGNYHLPVLRALAGQLPAGGPWIACKLSNPLERTGRGRLAQRIFATGVRATTGAVDLIVAMSPVLRAEAQFILRRDDISCIAEPTLEDERPCPPAAGTARRDPAAPSILCIGRLVPQKRFTLALRAFALLPADTGARLTILGDGPERPRLIAEAARLGIANRISFAGHVGDVGRHLAEARLLLCSSLYEGYPAVMVEALAAGVPVVTTRCSPAVAEIMAHPSFGLVAADTPAALAEAMTAQLARPRPAAAAIATLTGHHRIGRVADTYLDLFDRAVSSGARGRP